MHTHPCQSSTSLCGLFGIVDTGGPDPNLGRLFVHMNEVATPLTLASASSASVPRGVTPSARPSPVPLVDDVTTTKVVGGHDDLTTTKINGVNTFLNRSNDFFRFVVTDAA